MGIKFDKKKLSKDLQRAMDNIDYDRMARFIVNRTKAQTRKGISPSTGRPFKDLTRFTVAKRGRLSRINRTHPKYELNKSNLTFTGQLLNALTYAIKKGNVINEIIIFTKDSLRKPYNTFAGKEPALTNAEVQERVEEERPYVGLDKQGEDELKRILITEIEREIKKLNR